EGRLIEVEAFERRLIENQRWPERHIEKYYASYGKIIPRRTCCKNVVGRHAAILDRSCLSVSGRRSSNGGSSHPRSFSVPSAGIFDTCRYQKLDCVARKIRRGDLMLPIRQSACRTLVMASCRRSKTLHDGISCACFVQ